MKLFMAFHCAAYLQQIIQYSNFNYVWVCCNADAVCTFNVNMMCPKIYIILLTLQKVFSNKIQTILPELFYNYNRSMLMISKYPVYKM